MTREWTTMGNHDEPRDQQIDFDGPYWGAIGPDRDELWSYSIYDFDHDNDRVVGGLSPTEARAKYACETHGHALSMDWNVSQLSDDDLTKEIYFAKGFGPNRAGTPEDRWEAALFREQVRRQAG